MVKAVKPYDDNRWVIRCTDKKGYKGWYGEGRRRVPTVTAYLGHAYRYASELDAHEVGSKARGRGEVASFIVEELSPRPRFKKTADGCEGST